MGLNLAMGLSLALGEALALEPAKSEPPMSMLAAWEMGIRIPQTGDPTPITKIILLLSVSIIVLEIALIYHKKRKPRR